MATSTSCWATSPGRIGQRGDLAHSAIALLVGILLLVAAAGKSALIPFSGWLPRAMEGPTPSSAIFYGALSVHLGAFLLLRMGPLLELSLLLCLMVIGLGLATALCRGVSRRACSRISKSALAFASLTQVGLIVAEIGFASGLAYFSRATTGQASSTLLVAATALRYVALIHMLGHACLRTLQFLRASSVLQDYRMLENAIGERLSASRAAAQGVQERSPWLYRFALERGYLDALLADYIARPVLRVFQACDALERRWTDLLSGRPSRESGCDWSFRRLFGRPYMTGMFHFPWLTVTMLIPLVGSAVVCRLRDVNDARRWSVGFSAAALACSLGAWVDFISLRVDAAHGTDAALAQWLSLDNLSAPLLPLAALLYLLTAIATLRSKDAEVLLHGQLDLRIDSAGHLQLPRTLGHRDPAGARHAAAAVGTAPATSRSACTRCTWRCSRCCWSWVGHSWNRNAQAGVTGQAHSLWALVPLLAAVLIRCGIAPLHCWVTDLFEHATFGTALAFVTPMVGAYAAVRLILPTAPQEVLHAMGFVSLATAVYAAGMALVQREARRFFCYVFLSHSALVLVGLETVTPIGVTGALVVWLSMGLSLAGFGLTLRALEARHGRLSLVGYHGVYEHTPLLAICFMLTGMASVGFPGTFGFLGTELLVDGAIHSYPFVGLAVVAAAALNGIAVVQAYFKLFTGTKHISSVPLNVCVREQVAVLTLTALIVGGGLFPQPGIASRHHAAEVILRQHHKEQRPSQVASGDGVSDSQHPAN